MAVLLFIVGIALIVFIMIKVYPKKLDGQLSPQLQKIHNLIHFKTLYIVNILKFAYIVITIMSIALGIGMMCSGEEELVVIGLTTLLAGTIGARLSFEGTMMFILLIEDVKEINAKLSKKDS